MQAVRAIEAAEERRVSVEWAEEHYVYFRLSELPRHILDLSIHPTDKVNLASLVSAMSRQLSVEEQAETWHATSGEALARNLFEVIETSKGGTTIIEPDNFTATMYVISKMPWQLQAEILQSPPVDAIAQRIKEEAEDERIGDFTVDSFKRSLPYIADLSTEQHAKVLEKVPSDTIISGLDQRFKLCPNEPRVERVIDAVVRLSDDCSEIKQAVKDWTAAKAIPFRRTAALTETPESPAPISLLTAAYAELARK